MNINDQIAAIVKEELAQNDAIAQTRYTAILAELHTLKSMVEPGKSAPVNAPAETKPTTTTTESPAPGVTNIVAPPAPVAVPPQEEAAVVAHSEEMDTVITYSDLLKGGWTPQQVAASEFAHLMPPAPPEVDEVALAAQADAIINTAIARMPQGAIAGSHNDSCVFHIAKQFGKSTISEVSNNELIGNPDKVEAGVLETLESITTMGSKLPIPAPPGKSAESVTAPASNAAATSPAESVAAAGSTETELLKAAAGGNSVPAAPIFTPGGANPV